ncbi:MAG: YbaN family protein [Peptostreptococcaceae bacterium]
MLARIKKYIYVVVGVISLGLGIIGAIIPIFPTTPFLLLSSFCFARGSNKFDKWFKSTKIYKSNLESFINDRAMTIKQKMNILLFADMMLVFPIIILDSIYIRIFLLLLIAFKYYYFIFKIKTIKDNHIIKSI